MTLKSMKRSNPDTCTNLSEAEKKKIKESMENNNNDRYKESVISKIGKACWNRFCSLMEMLYNTILEKSANLLAALAGATIGGGVAAAAGLALGLGIPLFIPLVVAGIVTGAVVGYITWEKIQKWRQSKAINMQKKLY